MKVAIVHDWLVTHAGAENVLNQLLAIYPDADVFSLIEKIPEQQRDFLNHKAVTTSGLQKLPLVDKYYRKLLPLMIFMVEQFNLQEYDLVISSSSSVVKGIITGPRQLHLCYCHSPMRYAWDLASHYLPSTGKWFRGLPTRLFLHYVRLWDVASSMRVDHFATNSDFVRRRIEKVYRRPAAVIHPPVDTAFFHPAAEKPEGDYFITISRLVPYKKVDLIARSCARAGHKLIIIGTGPEEKKVATAGNNVVLRGYLPRDEVLPLLQAARAFIFMGEEDFGIAPLEAQACGIPVIAYGIGGIAETVPAAWVDQPWPEDYTPTGVFFKRQAEESLLHGLRFFHEHEDRFSTQACRANALRFTPEIFRRTFKEFVEKQWHNFQTGRK